MGISGTDPAVTYNLAGIGRAGATRANATSAKVFIAVNGVQYGPGRPVAENYVKEGTVSINEALNETADTAAFTMKGAEALEGQAVLITIGSINNRDPLYAGSVINRTHAYTGSPANWNAPGNAIDYTWPLTHRLVSGLFVNADPEDVAQAIVSSVPGFALSVQPGLPILDAISFTNASALSALTQLAARVGGYVDVRYRNGRRIVKLFVTDDSVTNPTPWTPSHATLTDFAFTKDLSPVRTRVLSQGYGSTAATAQAIGATSLPVVDISSFDAAGGMVAINQQRVTYAGIASGGSTVQGAPSTIAARPAPSSAAVLSLAGSGSNWGFGHAAVRYAFEYSDGVISTTSPISNDINATTLGSTFIHAASIAVGDARVVKRHAWIEAPGVVSPTSSSDPLTNFTRTALSTLADNVTTAADTTADGDSTHPTATAANYSAGAGFIYVADCAKFFSGGGLALVGSQPIAYTGRSASSGVGALTGVTGVVSSIAVGDTITAIVAAGSSSLPVADTTNFSGSGGTARIGSQTFTYTGRSASSGPGNLTGIPAGAGGLTSNVSGGDTVLVGAGGAGTLVGIPASGPGSILYAINTGDPINILEQVDDVDAQAALATLLATGTVASVSAANPAVVATTVAHGFATGDSITITGTTTTPAITGQQVITVIDATSFYVPVNVSAGQLGAGGTVGLHDGIVEEYLTDDRIGKAEAIARGQARIAQARYARVSVRGRVRDKNACVGRNLHVDMPAPTGLTGDFLIQQVSMDTFWPALLPRRSIEASTDRFSLENLISIMRQKAA